MNKEWNNFTKSQRLAFITLLCILIFFLFIKLIIRELNEKKNKNTHFCEIEYLHLKKKEKTAKYYKKGKSAVSKYQTNNYLELFPFDPNKVTEKDLQRLGLRPFQVRNIINYRKSGGVFNSKQDFKKLYTISQSDYDRLRDAITINNKIEKKDSIKGKKTVILELNKADHWELMHKFHIKSEIANRIINYRNKLGGFFSKHQLKEVYGVDYPEILLQNCRVIIDTFLIRKININTCDIKELSMHPYLKRHEAKSILEYRNFIRRINNIQEIEKNRVISDTVILKIRPYLIFQ